MSMYIYNYGMYVRLYKCMHTYMYECVCLYNCIYMYVQAYMALCMYVCVRVYVCLCTSLPF